MDQRVHHQTQQGAGLTGAGGSGHDHVLTPILIGDPNLLAGSVVVADEYDACGRPGPPILRRGGVAVLAIGEFRQPQGQHDRAQQRDHRQDQADRHRQIDDHGKENGDAAKPRDQKSDEGASQEFAKLLRQRPNIPLDLRARPLGSAIRAVDFARDHGFNPKIAPGFAIAVGAVSPAGADGPAASPGGGTTTAGCANADAMAGGN